MTAHCPRQRRVMTTTIVQPDEFGAKDSPMSLHTIGVESSRGAPALPYCIELEQEPEFGRRFGRKLGSHAESLARPPVQDVHHWITKQLKSFRFDSDSLVACRTAFVQLCREPRARFTGSLLAALSAGIETALCKS